MGLTSFEDDENLTHEAIGDDAVLHKGKLAAGQRHPHEAQPVIETTNVSNAPSTTKVVSVDPITGEREQVAGPVDLDPDDDYATDGEAVDAESDTEPVTDEATGEVVPRKLPRKKDK